MASPGDKPILYAQTDTSRNGYRERRKWPSARKPLERAAKDEFLRARHSNRGCRTLGDLRIIGDRGASVRGFWAVQVLLVEPLVPVVERGALPPDEQELDFGR